MWNIQEKKFVSFVASVKWRRCGETTSKLLPEIWSEVDLRIYSSPKQLCTLLLFTCNFNVTRFTIKCTLKCAHNFRIHNMLVIKCVLFCTFSLTVNHSLICCLYYSRGNEGCTGKDGNICYKKRNVFFLYTHLKKQGKGFDDINELPQTFCER